VQVPAESKPRLMSAVPQFTVPDVVQAAEYYRDTLGFQIAGYWAAPPQFAIVWRDDVELFFNRANGSKPRTGRARGAYDAYLRVAGVAALATELRGRGADIIEGPARREYGSVELVVRDCNGLVIAFGEDTSQAGT
jgi:catechol 2,3-dioxygenase-like lactoylglutathione lyase family enzyme